MKEVTLLAGTTRTPSKRFRVTSHEQLWLSLWKAMSFVLPAADRIFLDAWFEQGWKALFNLAADRNGDFPGNEEAEFVRILRILKAEMHSRDLGGVVISGELADFPDEEMHLLLREAYNGLAQLQEKAQKEERRKKGGEDMRELREEGVSLFTSSLLVEVIGECVERLPDELCLIICQVLFAGRPLAGFAEDQRITLEEATERYAEALWHLIMFVKGELEGDDELSKLLEKFGEDPEGFIRSVFNAETSQKRQCFHSSVASEPVGEKRGRFYEF